MIIRDTVKGAVQIDVTKLSTEDLIPLARTFPEAMKEYCKRLTGG